MAQDIIILTCNTQLVKVWLFIRHCSQGIVLCTETMRQGVRQKSAFTKHKSLIPQLIILKSEMCLIDMPPWNVALQFLFFWTSTLNWQFMYICTKIKRVLFSILVLVPRAVQKSFYLGGAFLLWPHCFRVSMFLKLRKHHCYHKYMWFANACWVKPTSSFLNVFCFSWVPMNPMRESVCLPVNGVLHSIIIFLR